MQSQPAQTWDRLGLASGLRSRQQHYQVTVLFSVFPEQLKAPVTEQPSCHPHARLLVSPQHSLHYAAAVATSPQSLPGIKLGVWFYQGLGSRDAEPLGLLAHTWLQVTYSMLQELSWKLSQLRGHVLFTVIKGMKNLVVGVGLPQAGHTEVLSCRPIWHTCIHGVPVL